MNEYIPMIMHTVHNLLRLEWLGIEQFYPISSRSIQCPSENYAIVLVQVSTEEY